jgi:hypothetical protein
MAALAASSATLLGAVDRAAAEPTADFTANASALDALDAIETDAAFDQVTSVSQLSDVQPTD